MRRTEERLKQAQRQPRLIDTTKRRLAKELQARVEHRHAIEALLEPLTAHAAEDPGLLRALMQKLSGTQALASYEQNPLRDWGWPETRENEISLALVRGALPQGHQVERLLILGGGAGRLAYDLHQALRPRQTVVLDVNPLLLLIAERMSRGKALTLQEFPLAPRGIDGVALPRRLSAPSAAADGLSLVFGDALQPPLARAAFDTVVTPWLIDILPEDPRHFFARVNDLVAMNGVWVSFGPLGFSARRPEQAYTRDEIEEIATQCGFSQPTTRVDSIPYLCSPDSGQQRHESVLTLAARKVSAAAEPARFQPQPAWLRDVSLPVPTFAAFQREGQMHAYYAGVLGMIDGRHSVLSMAEVIGRHHGLDTAAVLPALIGFLANLYEVSAGTADRVDAV